MLNVFPTAQNLRNSRNLEVWKIYISLLKKRFKKLHAGFGIRNFELFLNYIIYIGK